MRTRLTVVLTIVALLLAALPSFAQVSTSSITGQVVDSSGAVVAGAKVQAKNEATGVVYEGTTTGAGTYSFPSIQPGTYSVTVSQKGFQTSISVHNMLTVGQPLVVDVTLRVGAQNESVQVESSYERIETTNATISDVMTETQVKNLPLNGRNPLSLLTLEPGVVQRTTGGSGAATHVFGSRDRSHNITIDGIDANESTVPNPQSNLQRLTPDNVQEFRTVTLGATAENGRNSGANVMIGTKTGTNAFHGDVYHYLRNTVLNANEWFNDYEKQPRPKLNLNQWGFDLGGPIIKNKTFFFGSYQGNNIKQTAPVVSALGSTPVTYTNSMRSGIFRFVRGTVSANGLSFSRNDRRMVDSSGNLLPGIATCSAANSFQNCVDSYNIFASGNDPKGIGADPATLGLVKSLPLPNSFTNSGDGLNTGGFSWNPPTKFVGPSFFIRVDHTFGPNDNVFVRWLQNKFDTKEGDFLNSRAAVYPGFPPLGEVGRTGKNLAVSYRHTFSPSLVNEFTMGFNRFLFNFTFGESNPNFGDPSKLPPWGDFCVYTTFQNISTPYCVSPHTARGVTAPQFIDNLNWVHGAHTIRAGINFRFYIHNDSRGFFGSTILAPGIQFSGSNRNPFTAGALGPGVAAWGGQPARIGSNTATTPSTTDIATLAQAIDELAGLPSQISQSYFADFGANKYGNPLYATVYSRAHQYDSYIQDEWKVRPNLTLNAGLRWELNPAPYDAKQTLVPNVFPDGSQGPVTFVKSDKWFKNDNKTAFAPRMGIAWSPDGKTSIRAGYAWLFDVLSTFQVTAIAGKVPGFMQGCTTSVDSTGAIASTAGCSTASGMLNRISSGFPLSIATPTITPSAALTVSAQPRSLAPSVGSFDPNMKSPSIHEWSLTIQRELPLKFVSEVGYIGKRGTHLYRAYDLNQMDVTKPAGFLDSFNIARSNFLKGCAADGTACPTGVTGQTPTLLLTLVSNAFLTSSSRSTDWQRGNIGNVAIAMDNLALNSTQRRAGLTLNYFRPNPQFNQYFFQDAEGDSYYHGLYVSARRRFEQGMTFGLSYTYSKSIDDMSVDPTSSSTSGGLSTTSFSRTPTDIHNFRLDRSLSDFDNRHVFLSNLLYELPLGRGKKFFAGAPGWVNQIIGGWSTTGIFIYQSGEPYTLSSGVMTTNGSHVSTALVVGKPTNGQLTYNTGVEGPVIYQTNGFVTAPLSSADLNCQVTKDGQTKFCIPAPGQNGSGRNTVQGPNFWNLDSGLMKNFDLTERFKLQFRAEAFNVLNHPNFANPRNSTTGSATVTSSAFGQVCCATASVASTSQVNPIGEPMRVLQLGLKLTF